MKSIEDFFGTSVLRNKIGSRKHEIFDSVQEDVFLDISDKWKEFLESDKVPRMYKNSFIIWSMGGRGSGKTGGFFINATKIMNKNPRRNVCFWKTPQQLVDNIEKYCPEEFKGRFRVINKLRDIKKDDIFVIDEGLIGANAKEALKKEMRNLIKFLSKSRHLNIIAYINSISIGILRQFRETIDIVIYRRLPRMLIVNNSKSDYILDKYGERLTRLREWEAIVTSSYKRFSHDGFISIKLQDECTWFNDQISMYHENVNPDAEFDDAERVKKENTEVVKWVYSVVRDKYHEVRDGYRNFRMWLYDDHIDIYLDNQQNLKTIYELYCHYIDEDKFHLIGSFTEEEDDELEVLIKYLNESSILYDFSNIESRAVKKAKSRAKGKKKERDFQIYLERNTENTIELALKHGISEPTVYSALAKIRGKWNEIKKNYTSGSVNYFKGRIFETEFRLFLNSLNYFDNVEVDGGTGHPDVIANKDGKEYVFSVKNMDLRNWSNFTTITMSDIMPEALYCSKRDGVKKYLIIAVLNNETDIAFCFKYDLATKKDIDVNKMYAKYVL